MEGATPEKPELVFCPICAVSVSARRLQKHIDRHSPDGSFKKRPRKGSRAPRYQKRHPVGPVLDVQPDPIRVYEVEAAMRAQARRKQGELDALRASRREKELLGIGGVTKRFKKCTQCGAPALPDDEICRGCQSE